MNMQLTPTQIRLAIAHRERKERIRKAADRLARGKVALSGPEPELPSAPVAPPTAAEVVSRAVERVAEDKKTLGVFAVEPKSIRGIQAIVCRVMGISYIDLISERRHHEVVRPRMIAMFLCKKFTTRSYPEIGRRFGGRDHTTVMHSWSRIALLMKTDADLVRQVDLLSRIIEESAEADPVHEPVDSGTNPINQAGLGAEAK